MTQHPANMALAAACCSEVQINLTQALLQFVTQRMPEVPKLADAAAALHVSSRTLQRALQRNNCSFRQVIIKCRLHLAREYLQSNELSLQQIAFLLGFEEQSSFQKAFRSWQGCSPGRFRQNKQLSNTRHNLQKIGVQAGELWN